jgi:hypothetical protein
MNDFTRRGLIVGSAAGAVALAGGPTVAFAAPVCPSSYVPSRLTVDCASRRNFAAFRQHFPHVGLAAVVSTTAVAGAFGKYAAGNLFLFPCLKPKSQGLGVQAYLPVTPTSFRAASPAPWGAPRDEYLCRGVLRAPASAFIGVEIDAPFDAGRATTVRFTNIDALADGKPVGINWTSSNLNHPYFAGSRMIPATSLCNGAAWRKLIIDGLQQASAGVCT